MFCFGGDSLSPPLLSAQHIWLHAKGSARCLSISPKYRVSVAIRCSKRSLVAFYVRSPFLDVFPTSGTVRSWTSLVFLRFRKGSLLDLPNWRHLPEICRTDVAATSFYSTAHCETRRKEPSPCWYKYLDNTFSSPGHFMLHSAEIVDESNGQRCGIEEEAYGFST